MTPVMPDVVVRPDGAELVSSVLKLANERRIPVTPRCAAAGCDSPVVPCQSLAVLSCPGEGRTRILQIDEDNFTATVEPGVVLRTRRWRSRVSTIRPIQAEATIGGTVATNGAGTRCC